ncbi:glycosyltransferase family 39 protein [Paenibacillus sp. J22TS3]|uniref:ArnT family glycosyltransferase n=1 Tax=Paenibacillus sp. J22TS3 TaxID=2807192 RepID=UPI001B1042E3|nr:glycosyltransferase family 39 protein [Paenibacillus sp. J22TS3]GIP21959.1 hypothetical protein J22TS3_22340 [Paenibacillus sp. J22TS3]
MPSFWSKTYRGNKPAVLIALIVIFILAAYLRIDFLRSVQHNIATDTKQYDIMVRQILEKGVYGYRSTEPNAQVSPGLPMFMAAVYKLVDYKTHDPAPYIRYIQVVLSLFTLFLMYRLARRMGGTAAGLLTALAGAIYPSFIWSNGAVLTEVLCTFLLVSYYYVQIIAFERKTWKWAVASGALIGLTILTRPEFLPLIFVFHGIYFLWTRKWKETLKLFIITLVGTGIILSPWIIRNMVTMKQVVIAATQVNPFAAGTYPYNNYLDGMVDRHGKTQMEVAKERLYVGFTQKPGLFLKWYTIGKLDYIYGKMYFGAGHKPYYSVFPYAIRNLFHQCLVLFFLVALVGCARRFRKPEFLLASAVVVMSLIRLLFVPEFRYNYTAMPVIIILDCVIGVALVKWIYTRLKGRNNPAPALTE